MRVNILHLRTFYAIALDGSINQAARRMNVSQSTLSKQLKAFESRHKVTLFTGRTPPLKLTSRGEALLMQVQRVFAGLDEIDQALGEDVDSDQIYLRIGSDTPPLAARLAHDLKQVYHRLNLTLRIENARDTFENLRLGQTDMAIVMNPPVHAQFHYVPVMEDSLMAALPRDHPLASAEYFDIGDLAGETLLLRESSSRTRQALERMLLDQGVIPADQQEMNTRETIREGIALGMGVSFFFSLECPPDTRIVYRPIRSALPIPAVAIYLLFPSEKRTQALMRRAADLVRAWKATEIGPDGQGNVTASSLAGVVATAHSIEPAISFEARRVFTDDPR
ncbi:LysR substrate-binding domain-containing protein [Asticcacaulis sp. AC402]|uniref:LysR substrate-binding domain-containing protein n=1 Tax=Asticcacaulis sp. AC402 TaxID=1282361 RepID=UPI0003F9F74E|nr:LysR substrate-binding domain-containing protein [Asticcacaulis sp. AC402]